MHSPAPADAEEPAAAGLGAGFKVNVAEGTAEEPAARAPAKSEHERVPQVEAPPPHAFGEPYHGAEEEQRGTELPAAEEAEG
jgi:hypothetical protein